MTSDLTARHREHLKMVASLKGKVVLTKEPSGTGRTMLLKWHRDWIDAGRDCHEVGTILQVPVPKSGPDRPIALERFDQLARQAEAEFARLQTIQLRVFDRMPAKRRGSPSRGGRRRSVRLDNADWMFVDDHGGPEAYITQKIAEDRKKEEKRA